MSEEKNINEEVLNEEELDGVAGGYGWEIKDDKARFAALGIRITSGKNDEEQLKNAFARFGITVETYHGDWTKNEYRIKGKEITREQAWERIYSRVR